MKTSDFDYHLPPELIAQEPSGERGDSRLLLVDREADGLEDLQFASLPTLIPSGDLLVVNTTKVH